MQIRYEFFKEIVYYKDFFRHATILISRKAVVSFTQEKVATKKYCDFSSQHFRRRFPFRVKLFQFFGKCGAFFARYKSERSETWILWKKWQIRR